MHALDLSVRGQDTIHVFSLATGHLYERWAVAAVLICNSLVRYQQEREAQFDAALERNRVAFESSRAEYGPNSLPQCFFVTTMFLFPHCIFVTSCACTSWSARSTS